MLKINVDEFFDTYEYVQEINKLNFEDIDLSEFFTNADIEKKTKIKEKLTKLNNYNRIYVLVAYENLRTEFGLIMVEPKKEE